MTQPRFISINGRMLPYEEAHVHVLSPTVKYGALVFEGLRAYWNAECGALYVFRLAEHFRRFHRSVKAMRFAATYDDDVLTRTVLETLQVNEVCNDVHMRLSAYLEGTGLYDATGPVSLMCASYGRPSGNIEGKAVKAGVVSWRRIGEAATPPRLKVAANYHNARLGILEARANGHDEAIFLTDAGRVAEGAGACLMMVRDGVLVTPAITEAILESVTRATLLTLAEELGIPTCERPVDRSELFFADEVFFCGTGVEIQPVVAVDHLPVGNGRVGPIASQLWRRYEDVARGRTPDHAGWRTELPTVAG